jgi:3-oxoacyl-[acyl-carrier protein] reductase
VKRLEGKVALVTGAARGIGRSVSLAFAHEGARLYLVGNRDQAALDGVLTEVRALGVEAAGALYDVGDPPAAKAIADAIEQKFGTLDIVVNNAGILRASPILEITPEQWQNTLRVNLHGTFYVLQEMTRRFFKPQGRGKIINVTAPSALRGSLLLADYASSKGAIIALTRNAARELKPLNIQVNAVSPSSRTRMLDALAAARPADAERMHATPGPDAVAPTFVFLASNESDYMSGQILSADGGSSA